MFQTGIIPNKILVDLYAELAFTYSNQGLTPYHSAISRIVLNLTNYSDITLRISISKFFSYVCENILIQRESREQKGLNDTTVENEIIFLFSTSFDLILDKWIIHSQNKSLYPIGALFMISILINESITKNNLEHLLSLFINNIKNEDFSETYFLTKCYRIFLEKNLLKIKEKIETNCKCVIIALLSVSTSIHISPNVKDVNEVFLNIKSEVSKILFILFREYQHIVYPFLIAKFEEISLIARLTVVYILKGLLLRSNLNLSKEPIINAVCKATLENDLEFRYALIELIYVLFEKDLVTQEHSVKILLYILRECGKSDKELEAKTEFNGNYPFYTNPKIIRDKSESTLIDLLLKVNEFESLIWPILSEFFIDNSPKYNNCAYIICQLVPLIKDNYQLKKKELTLESKINFNNNTIHNSILIRIICLLASPLKRVNMLSHLISTIKVKLI